MHMSANKIVIPVALSSIFLSEGRRPDSEEVQEPSAGISSSAGRRHAELVLVHLQPEQLHLGRRRRRDLLLVPCRPLAAAVAGFRIHAASRNDGGSAAGDERAAAVVRQLVVRG